MAGIAVLDNMQRGLTALPGVKGIITVQNATSLPVRTTISSNLAAVIAHHVVKIIPKAKAVLAEVDPSDSCQFVRIRGKNFEYLVVLDKEYTMISIQEHTTFQTDDPDAVATNTGAMKMVTGADENANRGRFYNYNTNNFVEVSANRNTNNAVPWKQRKDRKSRKGRSMTPTLSGAAKEGGEEEERQDGAEVALASSSLSSDSYRRMRGAGSGYGGSGSAMNVKDFAKVNLQPRGY